MSRSVRVGDAVRISWPSDLIPEFKDQLDGKVGVVLSIAGRICTAARGHECLYRVNVAGLDRVHHLGSSHLEPLRPGTCTPRASLSRATTWSPTTSANSATR